MFCWNMTEKQVNESEKHLFYLFRNTKKQFECFQSNTRKQAPNMMQLYDIF